MLIIGSNRYEMAFKMFAWLYKFFESGIKHYLEKCISMGKRLAKMKFAGNDAFSHDLKTVICLKLINKLRG